MIIPEIIAAHAEDTNTVENILNTSIGAAIIANISTYLMSLIVLVLQVIHPSPPTPPRRVLAVRCETPASLSPKCIPHPAQGTREGAAGRRAGPPLPFVVSYDFLIFPMKNV